MEQPHKAALLVIFLSVVEVGIIPSFHAGFYCGDPKISFKFDGDTVSNTLLLTVSIVGPILLMWLVETLQCSDYVVPRLVKIQILFGLKKTLYWCREFLLGLGIVLFVTDVAKVIVGEPRPHFLDSCRPDKAVNCTTGYVASYKCTNNELSHWFVNDSTKSFPSGHTSISVYTMLFLMWFVQRRLTGKTYLLVSGLQCLCMLWAMLCSFTRITDHRHHWWDVLAGFFVGVVGAFFTIHTYCGGFFLRNSNTREMDRTKPEISRENGHILHNRQQSARQLLSSTSSYNSSILPEDRELREVTMT